MPTIFPPTIPAAIQRPNADQIRPRVALRNPKGKGADVKNMFVYRIGQGWLLFNAKN